MSAMYSFPTHSAEGRPQMDWYLADGAKAAYSVSLPPTVGEEFWEHYLSDGTPLGRSIRTPEGHAHYTPENDLIAESETLAGFWDLCEVAVSEESGDAEVEKIASSSGGKVEEPAVETKSGAAKLEEPATKTESPAADAVNLTVVKAVAVLASTTLAAAFVFLWVPAENLFEGAARAQAEPVSATVASVFPTGGYQPKGAAEGSGAPPVTAPSTSLSPSPAVGRTTSMGGLVTAPKQEPGGPTAQTVRDFLVRLRQLENEHALEAILPCYADRVVYFDQGIVSNDFIGRDKAAYYKQWPVARYEIQDEVMIEDGPPPGSYESVVASYVSSFELRNAQGRHITGKARSRYHLVWTGGRFVITAEKAEVLDKVVASTGPTAAATVPAAGTAEPSAELARAFAMRLRELENDQLLDEVMKAYADQVKYYKTGLLGAAEVRKDKAEYFQRWPVARQTVIGGVKGVQASRVQEGLYEVSYYSDFQASNPDTNKAVKGRCHCLLTLRWQDGNFLVVQEGGEVIYKDDVSASHAASTKTKPSSKATDPKKKTGDEAFRDSVRRFSRF